VVSAALVTGCTSTSSPPPLTVADETISTDPSGPPSWGPSAVDLTTARAIVARMTDRELVGQLFVAGYRGPAAPAALVERYHLGGVIVMPANIDSVAGVAASNSALQASVDRYWPLVIAVDQEGGSVARLGPPMTEFPTYMSLGAADRPRLAEQVALTSGRELRAAGFTMVFAPDADVTMGPGDPTIGSRSAGSRPTVVARTVAASLAGYRRSGIIAVAKHFPGHGSVVTNSHRGLPHQHASVAQLNRQDFVPFKRAIAAHVSAVMVGHISLDRVDRDVPADLSRPVMQLLTRSLQFEGLVTTDALNMAAVTEHYRPGEAAIAALKAGADLLVLPPDLPRAYGAVLRALRSGALSRDRLEESAAKIGALMLHESTSPIAARAEPGRVSALTQRVSAAAITVVAGECTGPYVGGAVRPVGDPVVVRSFRRAAHRAGLATRSGPRLALLGETRPKHPVAIAVSLGTPYVLAGARTAGTKLALFGWTPGAMEALVDVLLGHADPQGSLPVDIPALMPPRCS
jgi:beta-N-acetylhexosaminidase